MLCYGCNVFCAQFWTLSSTSESTSQRTHSLFSNTVDAAMFLRSERVLRRERGNHGNAGVTHTSFDISQHYHESVIILTSVLLTWFSIFLIKWLKYSPYHRIATEFIGATFFFIAVCCHRQSVPYSYRPPSFKCSHWVAAICLWCIILYTRHSMLNCFFDLIVYRNRKPGSHYKRVWLTPRRCWITE